MRNLFYFVLLVFALLPFAAQAQCDVSGGVLLELQATTNHTGLLIGKGGCVFKAATITPLQTSNDTLRLINGGTIGYVLTWNGTIWIPAVPADNSPNNEIQTLSAGNGAGSDKTINLSLGGGAVVLREGANVSLTRTNDTITIASTGGGGGGATDLTFSGANSPVTLNSSTGTDVTFTAGSGIGLAASTSNMTITNTDPDQLTNNEGILGVGTGGANSSLITSNTSGANGVTIEGGTGITVTESTSANGGTVTVTNAGDLSNTNELQTFSNTSNATSHTLTLSVSGGSMQMIEGTGINLTTGGSGLNGTVTITNTDPDQSDTNEALTVSDGTDSEALGGQTLNFSGAGIITADYQPATNTMLISGFEGDGSTNNEGILGVGTGGANSSLITSNTSGANGVTIEGGTGITVTESTSANGGTVTIAASGGGSVQDSTWVKYNGSYLNKRITDNVYRFGTTSLRSNDTAGIFNIYAQAHPKAAIYSRYKDASSGFLFFQLDPDGQTNNSGLGNFNFWGTNFQNVNLPYSTRANHVWRMGYNTGAGGGRVLTTDADLHIAFESNYHRTIANSPVVKRGWEWHLESQDTLGVVHRPITFGGSHDGFYGDLALNNDVIFLGNYAGAAKGWFSFAPGNYIKGLTFLDTTTIQFFKPQVGVDLLRTRNAADNGSLSILRMDANNRLVINSQGNDIYTYGQNLIFNTLSTIATNDANAIQIGKSGLPSNLVVFSPNNNVVYMKTTNETTGWIHRVNATSYDLLTPLGYSPLIIDENAPQDAMYFKSDGDIGLGTVFPSARLHVFTSIGATKAMLKIQNSTGYSSFFRSNTTPEGAITGDPGDIAQTNISSLGGLWVKKIGSGSTGWERTETAAAIVTRAVPTTIGATQEIGVITHNDGGRGALAEIDLVVAASGFVTTKSYIIPLTFNSTSSNWQILLPISSLGGVGGNDINLEMRTNTSGSPSGGIDTLRIVRVSGSTAANAICTIRFLSAGTNTTFTETSATGTSTTTATYNYNSLTQYNNKTGVNVAYPARTLHVNGEVRITDLTTDTPTKIIGADADGDLDTVGIGAEAELHLTNGTLGTNFHTIISPTSLTAGMTNNWNPTGLSTAWIIRMSGDDKFEMVTGITAPSFAKRLTIHNTGSNAILFPTENTSSTAGNRFSFGRDVVLFPKKSIEIIYDPTTARWRLLSKAGIYDDVENQYFNKTFQAPVSLTSGDYDFWTISSTASASAVAPTNGLLRGVSVNTGASATGCGNVSSKEQFVSLNTVDGSATWGYVKAKIVTPSSLSSGTQDYALRIGFLAGVCGSDLVEGAYFYYNHSINSGAWSCFTQNAGNSQASNSGVTVAASTIYTLEVVYRPNISVEFFINGTRVATNDTFIPDGDAMKVVAEIEKQGGTAQRDLQIYLLQTSIAHVN